ncbi:MAG: hypothetical protein EON89_13330 [Brevundimonas sp.]|nr:MAG: hypothetical protein EON89_13330 [Brevundimonas sp.]
MRVLAISVIALLAAGTAQASERLSDGDYAKLGRCAGLATAAGQDAHPYQTRLQAERSNRIGQALLGAQNARRDAQRQFRSANAETRERLNQELTGTCAALVG